MDPFGLMVYTTHQNGISLVMLHYCGPNINVANPMINHPQMVGLLLGLRHSKWYHRDIRVNDR